jgi:8-oxo-dGTP pyrophosphatase MutT (NUDIX family)
MPPVNLRHSVRAVILDEQDRVLLCRITLPEPDGAVVWVTPGGGIEPREPLMAALRRELLEEVGLAVDASPPHIWHQRVVAPGQAAGYDGVINDYFLIRAVSFQPRGSMSDAELAAENIAGFRWWPLREIAGYLGSDLFSPRDLAALLASLIADGVPATPAAVHL